MRRLLVLAHRALGLTTAGFLAVAGLTGAILAFHHEIDAALNPQFHHCDGVGIPLRIDTLADRAHTDHPGYRVLYIESSGWPGEPALVIGELENSRPSDPGRGNPWWYLDPVTGTTVATRFWQAGATREGFLPLIFALHERLLLPGNWGVVLMGTIAILWVFDTLLSLPLTFPRGRPFREKWAIAWRIRKGASTHRFTLDLHRAGALWIWPLLLLIAISSVAMNLPESVFKPAVSLFSPVAPGIDQQRAGMAATDPEEPAQDFTNILRRGWEEISHQGLNEPVHALYLNHALNYYAVGYGNPEQLHLGSAWLYFDTRDGHLLRTEIPGRGTAGEIFTQLQPVIHGGQIAGLPGRILIAACGIMICTLSISGVLIWQRKRQARRHRPDKRKQIFGHGLEPIQEPASADTTSRQQ